MTIRTVEMKTGLDRSSIRYYAKEDFVQPTVNEQGRLEFTEADIELLQKIKRLRQLGTSLDRIRQIRQGSGDFLQALEQEIYDLERRLAITGIPSTTNTYHESAVPLEFHPVRRYLARALDYSILIMLIELIVVAIIRVRPYTEFIEVLISFLVPLISVPIQAYCISKWSATPGKWLFGLAVESTDGGKLGFSYALDREWSVLLYGLGLGIPVYEFYRQYKSYSAYSHDALEWDQECRYYYRDWKFSKKMAVACTYTVLVLAVLLSFSEQYKPVYRGNLSISQFSSNFNDYLRQFDDAKHDYLDEKGQKIDYETQGHAVIVVGATGEDSDFQYTTEGETLKEITYSNNWTEVSVWHPLNSKLYCAAVTMVMSQKDASYLDYRKLNEQFLKYYDEKIASFTVCNVQVEWQIATEDCVYTGNWYISDTEDATISIDYSVTILD